MTRRRSSSRASTSSPRFRSGPAPRSARSSAAEGAWSRRSHPLSGMEWRRSAAPATSRSACGRPHPVDLRTRQARGLVPGSHVILGLLEGIRNVARLAALAGDQPSEPLLGQRRAACGPRLHERQDDQATTTHPLEVQLERERVGAQLLGQRAKVDRSIREAASKAQHELGQFIAQWSARRWRRGRRPDGLAAGGRDGRRGISRLDGLLA